MPQETTATDHPPAKFSLGEIAATANARDSIPHEEILHALSRHVRGDWGMLEPDDWNANVRALTRGGRLFSSYRSTENVKFYIITECDRSRTTALLPEDY